MKYRVKKETKPKLSTFGMYKAVAVHERTIESRQICKEAAMRLGVGEGDVLGIMLSLAEVVNRHLRKGDRVRLENWGMLKLEIESDKVERARSFRANKHIRGVRLHFLPESYKGSQALYEDIRFEKDKNYREEEG